MKKMEIIQYRALLKLYYLYYGYFDENTYMYCGLWVKQIVNIFFIIKLYVSKIIRDVTLIGN